MDSPGTWEVLVASYPAGVPSDIDPDKYRSLVEVFEEAVVRYFESPAFVSFGTTLSYRQLEERSGSQGRNRSLSNESDRPLCRKQAVKG